MNGATASSDRSSLLAGELVHIAGLVVEVGPSLRQRCAWCAQMLIDYDLRRVAMVTSPGEDADPPRAWPVGALVAVDGGYASVVEHADGEELPVNACARSWLTPSHPGRWDHPATAR